MALGIQGVGQDYNKIKLQDLNKSDVAAVVAQNQDLLNNPFVSKIGNDIAANDVKNNSPVDTAAIIAEIKRNKNKTKQAQMFQRCLQCLHIHQSQTHLLVITSTLQNGWVKGHKLIRRILLAEKLVVNIN